MIDSADDAVTVGRAAWARIRDHGRKNFDDWICVARALQIGRTAALRAAGTNRAVGSKYNLAMGRWLADHQLDGVVAQERYRCLLILQNLDAISAWRAGLDEAQRRRSNHPNAVWHAWKRSTKITTPKREYVRHKSSHRHGRPIYFGQDMLRRAAMALRECPSGDIFRLARVALEAAIRSESDLIELLPPGPVAMSAMPRRTDVVSAVG